MKIGIFGGTFNPIHLGHIEAIKNVKDFYNLDQVFIVPSNITPSKFAIEIIEPQHRIKMIELLLEDLNYSWLKCSKFEILNKGYSYTYLTIEHFKKNYPDDELFFIMGDDRYKNFFSWEKYDYILESTKLIVLQRNPEKKIKLSVGNYYTKRINKISSSEILSEQKWESVHPLVKKYISDNKLYLKSLVYYALKDKRYIHSVSVATHAKRLAKKYGFKNIKKAYLAGLIHDVFKYKDFEEQKKFIRKYYDAELPPDKTLHGLTCALWFEYEYELNDYQIFDSIWKHTIPDSNMSLLDKIIYVSDKIANDRLSSTNKRWRRMAYQNLELTFEQILKKQFQNSNTSDVNLQLKAAYEKYVLKINKKNR